MRTRVGKFRLAGYLLALSACASQSAGVSPWPLPSESYVLSVAANFEATLLPVEKKELTKVDFLNTDPANLDAAFAAALRFTTGTRAGKGFCREILLGAEAEGWWCARAILVAASTEKRRVLDGLIAVLVGAQVERLDSKMPYVNPPEECGAKSLSGITAWEYSGDKAWFRARSAFWVKCRDGKYQTYLPERGWFNPPDNFKPT